MQSQTITVDRQMKRYEVPRLCRTSCIMTVCNSVFVPEDVSLNVVTDCSLSIKPRNYVYIYIYGYWVVSGPHGTAFINCTCMFEGYIYLPSTHIYQRHS